MPTNVSEVRVQKYIYTMRIWEDTRILVQSKKMGKQSLSND